MKILIGTTFDMKAAGGLQSHIFFLKQALTAQQIDSELIFPNNSTYWRKIITTLFFLGNIDRARIEFTKIKTNNLRKLIEKITSKQSIDLIHTHDVVLAESISNLTIPVVLTVHGPITKEALMSNNNAPIYLNYLRGIEQQAYHRAQAIIAVDTGQKEIMVSDYNVPPEKISVIYNAVDTSLFAPHYHKKTKQYFLVPRRLVPKNGVSVAIKALRCIEDIKTELWIAGDGPEHVTLKRLAEGLNLTSRVRFLGSVNRQNMVRLINESIGVIIPSVPVSGVIEATSIAALEGMSMAKPVFASNIGGLIEIIKNGETGILFKAGDANALGAALCYALKNKESIENIGKKARDYVIANHSLEVWIKQILGVYQSVLRYS